MLIKVIDPVMAYSPLRAPGGIPQLKEGTSDHEEFWSEQRERCLIGYKPKGKSWIPPNLYWHLNMWSISRKRFDFDMSHRGNKINSFPLYRDVDDEIIFKTLYEARQDKNGGRIYGKRRRIGITDGFISHSYWELAMFPESQILIGTPNKKALTNIRGKFHVGHNNVPKDFFQNLMIENQDQYKIGVVDNSPEGERELGTLSSVFWKVFTTSGVFKGAWASFGIIDEIGEFTDNPSLLDCFMETIDCFKEGDEWIGTPVLAGTTDTKNMKNTQFMNIYNNHKAFDLEKIFIPADYYWGDKYFNFSSGKSDRDAAKKAIETRKAELNRLSDKTALLKYRQNNPLSENDMFLVMGNSAINMQRINDQIKKTTGTIEGKYFGERGNFMWAKYNKSGKVVWGVVWVKTPDGRWYKQHEPINDQYPDADIVGVDDFFKDDAPFSESLGGICVYRRYVPNINIISKIPVCTYLYRPQTLAEFHEDSLMTTVYYKAKASVEFHNPMFKEHFLQHEKVKGANHLKVFPRIMNKIVNPADAFGYHVGGYEKEIITSRISEWVNSPAIENCHDAQFLEQIGIFGTQNADLGSAFGICLLYEADLATSPVRAHDDMQETKRVTPAFGMGENGVPVSKRYDLKNTTEMRRRHAKLHWMNTLNT